MFEWLDLLAEVIAASKPDKPKPPKKKDMGAQGTAVLDFGAFPGKSDASVAVTGQGGIISGSLVEAWIRPTASADHSADEHMVETIGIVARDIVAATGFTIYGYNTSQLNEPNPGGGKGTRLWGQWNVAWVWN